MRQSLLPGCNKGRHIKRCHGQLKAANRSLALAAVIAAFVIELANCQTTVAPANMSSFLTSLEIDDIRTAFPLCMVNMPNLTLQNPVIRVSVNVTELKKPGERLQVTLDSARLGIVFNSVFITAQYVDPVSNTRVFGKIGRWLSDKKPFTPAITTCEAAETMPPASGAVLNSGRNSLSSVRFLWDAPESADISSSGTMAPADSSELFPSPLPPSVFQYISFLVVVWQSGPRVKWVMALRTPPIHILYMSQGMPRPPPTLSPVTNQPSGGRGGSTPLPDSLNLFSKLLGIENCLIQSGLQTTLPAINRMTTERPRLSTVIDLADPKMQAFFSINTNQSNVNVPGERITLTINLNMPNMSIDSVVIATAVVIARRGMPPYLKGVEGSWVPGNESETVLCNGYIAIRSKGSALLQFLTTWLAPAIVREKIFVVSAVVSSGGVVYKLPPLAISGPSAAVSTASLSGDGLNAFLSSLGSICSPNDMTSPTAATPQGDWPPPTSSFGQTLPFRIEAVPAYVRDDIMAGSRMPSAFNISVVGIGDADSFRFIFIQCRPADPPSSPILDVEAGRRGSPSGRGSQQQYLGNYRRRQHNRAKSIGFWRSSDQPRIKLRSGPCLDSALVTDDLGAGLHSASFQLNLLPSTQGDLVCRMILGKDNTTYWSTEYALYRATELNETALTSSPPELMTTEGQQRATTTTTTTTTPAPAVDITTLKSVQASTTTTAKAATTTTTAKATTKLPTTQEPTAKQAETTRAAQTTKAVAQTTKAPETTRAAGTTKAAATTRAAPTTAKIEPMATTTVKGAPPTTTTTAKGAPTTTTAKAGAVTTTAAAVTTTVGYGNMAAVVVEAAKCLLPPMMTGMFDTGAVGMVAPNAANNPYKIAVSPVQLATDSSAKVTVSTSDPSRPIAALLLFAVWVTPNGYQVANVGTPAGSFQLDSTASNMPLLTSLGTDSSVQCTHKLIGQIRGIGTITPGLVQVDAFYFAPTDEVNVTNARPAILGAVLSDGKVWQVGQVLLTLLSNSSTSTTQKVPVMSGAITITTKQPSAAVTTATSRGASGAATTTATAKAGTTTGRAATTAVAPTTKKVPQWAGDESATAVAEVAKCLLPPMMVDLFDTGTIEMVAPNVTNNPYSIAANPLVMPATDSSAKVTVLSSDPSRPIAAVLAFVVWVTADGRLVNGSVSAGSLQLDSSASDIPFINSFGGDNIVQCNHARYGHINGIATITAGLVEVDAKYYTPSQWDLNDANISFASLHPAIMGGVLGGGKLWRIGPVILTLTGGAGTTARPVALSSTTKQPAAAVTTTTKQPAAAMTTGKLPSGVTTAKPAAATTTAQMTTIAVSATNDIGLPTSFTREVATCLLPTSLGGIASTFAFEPYSSPSNPYTLSMQPGNVSIPFGSATNVSVASTGKASPVYAYLLFALWLTPSANGTWAHVRVNDAAGIFSPGQETTAFIGDDPELTRVRCANVKFGNVIGLASLAPNLMRVDAQWFAPFSLPTGYNFSTIKPAIFAGVFADQKLWELRPVVVTLKELALTSAGTTAKPAGLTTAAGATTAKAGVTTTTSKQAAATTTTASKAAGETTTKSQAAAATTTTAAKATTAGQAVTTARIDVTSKPAIGQTTTQVAMTTAGGSGTTRTIQTIGNGTVDSQEVAKGSTTAAPGKGTTGAVASTTTVRAGVTTGKVGVQDTTAAPATTRVASPAVTTTRAAPTVAVTTAGKVTMVPTLPPAVSTATGSISTTKASGGAVTTMKPSGAVTTAKPSGVVTTLRVATAVQTTEAWSRNVTTTSSFADSAVPIGFDCRRHNHDCKLTGGFCDTDTGKCRCSGYYSAYDCRVLTSLIRDDGNCNNGRGCGRGEQFGDYCLTTGRDTDKEFTQCSCSYGSYGPDCNRSRVELSCGETEMMITINPFPSFSVFEGHVFLLNHTNDVMVEDEMCRFNASDMAYQFSMPYQTLITRCGGEMGPDNSYSVRFVIQNHPHWLTAYDQILSAKCILTVIQPYEKSIVIQTNGNVRLYSGANALSNLPENFIVGEHTRIIPRPAPQPLFSLKRVYFDAKNGNYSVAPVVGPVKIGDTVMFNIENSNSTIYTSMRTEDCTLTMDNSIEMKLITRACPASRAAWTLLRWDKTIVTNSTLSFWLRLPANALSGWPRQIDIYCRVKLCLEDSADQCEISTKGCRRDVANFLPSSVTLKNYGRRRREAADTAGLVPVKVKPANDGFDHEKAHLLNLHGEAEDDTPVVYATVHYSFQLAADESESGGASDGGKNSKVSDDSSVEPFEDDPVEADGRNSMMKANADALRQASSSRTIFDRVGGNSKLSTTRSSKATGDTLSSSLGAINQWLLIGLMFVVFLLIAAAGLIFYLSYRLRHSQQYTLSTAG